MLETLGIVRSSLPTAWEVYTTQQVERHSKINTEEELKTNKQYQKNMHHQESIIQCLESIQLTSPAETLQRKYLLLLIAVVLPANI